MIHRHVTENLRDRAVDYVLGFLSAAQAAAVEAHLEEGCQVCAGEVQVHRHLVDLLLVERPSAQPPAELRERLLALIQGECSQESGRNHGLDVETDAIPAGWTIVRAAEGKWMAGEDKGTAIKVLGRDDAEGCRTMLVRLKAEGCYPGFSPAGPMELYLIEGDLLVNGERLGPGDYCAAPAGTVLHDMESPGGCQFLLLRPDLCEAGKGTEGGFGASTLIIVRAAEGTWLPGPAAGVTVKPLFRDPARQTESYLVRAEPGSRLPRHRHVGPDEAFFLEGDGRMGTLVLEAGDFYRAEAGTVHDVSWTARGCLCITLASVAGVAE
jgi:anti-sigma factor ChrR (cupin superfamily)